MKQFKLITEWKKVIKRILSEPTPNEVLSEKLFFYFFRFVFACKISTRPAYHNFRIPHIFIDLRDWLHFYFFTNHNIINMLIVSYLFLSLSKKKKKRDKEEEQRTTWKMWKFSLTKQFILTQNVWNRSKNWEQPYDIVWLSIIRSGIIAFVYSTEFTHFYPTQFRPDSRVRFLTVSLSLKQSKQT